MSILDVKYLWDNLSLSPNLAYRIVNDRVFCQLTGSKVKNKYSIIEGMGKEAFVAMGQHSSFENFIDFMLANYTVDRKKLITDLYQFLRHLVELHFFENSEKKKHFYIQEESIKNKVDVLQLMIKSYSEKAFPFKVFLELTHKCNHRCKHCYLGKKVEIYNKSSKNGLPIVRILKLFEEMKEKGVLQLILTGGEALLYPNFRIVLEEAVKLRFAVSLLTNASLLNEEMIEFISSFPIDEIRIPLYGGETYHNWFVGDPNSYKKVMWSLKQLKSRDVNVVPTAILTNKNTKDIIKQKSILHNMGLNLEISPLIFPTIYRDLTPTYFRIQNEQLSLLKKFDILLQRSKCVAGISRFRITPEGEVNACEMLPFSFGNVNRNSFGEILELPFRTKWIQEFGKLLKNKEKQCEKCSVYEYCIGCPGLSYLETGNLRGRSQEACRLAHFYEKGDV